MIFLIGPCGAGKSTIAEFIANKIACDHYDIDRAIMTSTGKTIAKIVEENGWEYFRKLETQTLYDILKKYMNFPKFTAYGSPRTRAVISVGGGFPLSPINRKLMRESGYVVYLNATVDLLIERLPKNPLEEQRPPLTDAELREETECLLSERCSVYKECANITINAARSLEEIAFEVTREAPHFFNEHFPHF